MLDNTVFDFASTPYLIWYELFPILKGPVSCPNAILPLKILDRKFQEDWIRDAREDFKILMRLMIDYEFMG